MVDASSDGPGSPPPGRRYQFSLSKLFLVTTLVALLGAGWAGLSQVAGSGPWSVSGMVAVILLVLAGPPAALIGVSLFRSAFRWFQHRGR